MKGKLVPNISSTNGLTFIIHGAYDVPNIPIREKAWKVREN